MNPFFNDPESMLNNTSIVERFVQYVKIETTSDGASTSSPSTANQFILAHKLVEELKDLGLDDARVNENCYVIASLASNCDTTAKVGLIAHLDTSQACSGKNVNPVFHKNFDGEDIVLGEGVVIPKSENPNFKKCIGDTIITADGSTLLGADDKAGIAVIMSAMEYYKANPKIPRPHIRVGFTPDEEIGRGASKFPIEEFDAEVAFTIDGSFDGEVNIETFNAESVLVTFTGVSTHPGSAKGKMVNALRYLGKFLEQLPTKVSPEHTEKREGFIHPCEVKGDSTSCQCHLIIRDFDADKLALIGEQVKSVVESVKQEEPRLKVDVEIHKTYPNMYEILKEKPAITEKLLEAVKVSGITPMLEPIRGGTDGSSLTLKGLPCPNIFNGGMNFHGPTEWVSTRSMGLSLCTVLNLLYLFTKK